MAEDEDLVLNGESVHGQLGSSKALFILEGNPAISGEEHLLDWFGKSDSLISFELPHKLVDVEPGNCTRNGLDEESVAIGVQPIEGRPKYIDAGTDVDVDGLVADWDGYIIGSHFLELVLIIVSVIADEAEAVLGYERSTGSFTDKSMLA